MRSLITCCMLLLFTATSAASQTPDSPKAGAAAIAAAQALLQAISTRDTALARRVLVPGATLAAIADPASPTAVPRIQSDTAFLNGLMTRPNRLLERMWAPTAYVNGTIALVYAPYDFYIDGTFSHCGVDTFTLELAPQGWRVSHIAYTVQRTGCAPSPLGPPTDR